jgi:hypothetical protein
MFSTSFNTTDISSRTHSYFSKFSNRVLCSNIQRKNRKFSHAHLKLLPCMLTVKFFDLNFNAWSLFCSATSIRCMWLRERSRYRSLDMCSKLKVISVNRLELRFNISNSACSLKDDWGRLSILDRKSIEVGYLFSIENSIILYYYIYYIYYYIYYIIIYIISIILYYYIILYYIILN